MQGYENTTDVADVAEEDKMNISCIFQEYPLLCALNIDKNLGELFQIYSSY